MLSSDYVWLSVAGVRTLTDRREGKRVMLSRGAGRPVEHSLCGGELRRDTAPSCAFHMGASLLSKLLRVVTDTDRTGYKLLTFHLTEKLQYDGDCVITVFQVIIRRSKTKML